jgi:hypothetical protein
MTYEESDDIQLLDKYKEIIQQIDKGILLGAPLPKNINLLPEIASNLNKYCLRKSNQNQNQLSNQSIIKLKKNINV